MMQPEIIVIGIVILIQVYVFFRTFLHTSDLKNIFPEVKPNLKSIQLSAEEVHSISEKALTAKINNTETVSDLARLFVTGMAVDIIEPKANYNASFKNILESTNLYLTRNKNHAADFRIIKEIAEREVEAQENQIETTINLPLYLGLLGTIVGIVLGLYSLYPAGAEDTEALIRDVESEIPKLLGGVAIAMIASFIGLLFTIISNGHLYKSAIKHCDQRKNKYFSFIQTELLPILSKDTKNSIEELKDTLNKFNNVIRKTIKNEFSDSVKVLNTGVADLNTAIGEIMTVQELQNESITELNKVDFDSMVVMFGNIKTSGIELNKGFDAQKELLKYIYDSLQQIKEKEKDTRSFIAELDNTFKKAAEVLSDSAKGEMNTFKSFVADEKNVLQKAIERHRPQFEQLTHLETIDKKLEEVNALNQMNKKFDQMLKQMEDGNKMLAHQISQSNKELITALQNIEFKSGGTSLIPFKRRSNTTKSTSPKDDQGFIDRLKKLFVK